MSLWEFLDATAYHIGAVLVLLFCFIYMELKWHINKDRNRYYLFGLFFIMIQAVGSIAVVYGIHVMGPVAGRPVYLAGDYIYFVCHAMLAPFYFVYFLIVTQSYTRIKFFYRVCFMIPFALTEFIFITNPLHHWGYYYDMDATFHRGWGEYFLYIVAAVYILASIWIILVRWTAIAKKRKLIMFISFMFSIMGIVFQAIFPTIQVELFAESLTMLGIMLSIEYDDDKLDSASHVYNRMAMIQDLNGFMMFKSTNYCVCAVRILDVKYLNRNLGVAVEDIQEEIGARLSAIYPRFRIYRVTTSVFLLYLPTDDINAAITLAEDIKESLSNELVLGDISVPIRFTLACALVPEELRGMDDILLLCETDMPEDKTGQILYGKELSYLRHRDLLDKAIRRGINNHSFKMEYQLIYDPEDMSVCAAESLIRLEDKELGDLYPEDFIPTAERNGLIDKLGVYALREVCTFIASGIPEWSGIKYISVNLSIIQCMDVDFAERALELVQSYGVLPKMINFEVTEQVASTDYAYVARVVRDLKEKGFIVSMQGYGAGNTDMYSLFSMGFDVIKLDKSLLWQAKESERGMIIFNNCVKLIRDLGRKVVAVGIETVDQMKDARKAGVDSVQGYYFSGPMSSEELVSLVGGEQYI